MQAAGRSWLLKGPPSWELVGDARGQQELQAGEDPEGVLRPRETPVGAAENVEPCLRVRVVPAEPRRGQSAQPDPLQAPWLPPEGCLAGTPPAPVCTRRLGPGAVLREGGDHAGARSAARKAFHTLWSRGRGWCPAGCWALSHSAGFLFPLQGADGTLGVTERSACSPGNREPPRGWERRPISGAQLAARPQEVRRLAASRGPRVPGVCSPGRASSPVPSPGTRSFVLSNRSAQPTAGGGGGEGQASEGTPRSPRPSPVRWGQPGEGPPPGTAEPRTWRPRDRSPSSGRVCPPQVPAPGRPLPAAMGSQSPATYV